MKYFSPPTPIPLLVRSQFRLLQKSPKIDRVSEINSIFSAVFPHRLSPKIASSNLTEQTHKTNSVSFLHREKITKNFLQVILQSSFSFFCVCGTTDGSLTQILFLKKQHPCQSSLIYQPLLYVKRDRFRNEERCGIVKRRAS